MAEVADVQVRLEATAARFEKQMRSAAQAFERQANRINRGSERLTKSMDKSFGAVVAKIAAVSVAVVAMGKGIETVSRNGDRLRQLEARFTAMTDSAERGSTIMRNLVDLSLRTGVSIDALGVSFSRFTLAAKSLNATDEQVRQFTENIIKMARISGTAGGELDGALRQLGQALGSGVLRGDELNSIFEAMPNVIEAVADEMGVTIGQIRELASEGKVVSDIVFQAILKKTGEIDEAIKKLPDSMATASGKMATAWQVFASELDKTIGASRTLVSILEAGATTLRAIGAGLEALNSNGDVASAVFNALPGSEGAGGLVDPTGAISPTGEGMTVEEQARMKALLSGGTRGVAEHDRRKVLRQFREIDAASMDQYMALPGKLPEAPTRSATPVARGMDAYLDFLHSNRRTGGGGGSRAVDETGARLIEQMKERLGLLREETRLIGLTEIERERLAAQFDRERMERELVAAAQIEGSTLTAEDIAGAKALAAAIEAEVVAMAEKEEAMERLRDKTRDAEEEQRRMIESVRDMTDRMFSAVQGARSLEDALKRVGFELLSIGAASLTGSGPLGGVVNKALGTTAGGIIGALFSAKGNVFNRGNVVPFAKGGVVGGPTSFPMPNGMGIMGEKGPEAIMPLQRGPGGKLGVAATGGGGPVVNITNYYDGVNDRTRAIIQQENARTKAEILRAVPVTASTGFRRQPGLR